MLKSHRNESDLDETASLWLCCTVSNESARLFRILALNDRLNWIDACDVQFVIKFHLLIESRAILLFFVDFSDYFSLIGFGFAFALFLLNWFFSFYFGFGFVLTDSKCASERTSNRPHFYLAFFRHTPTPNRILWVSRQPLHFTFIHTQYLMQHPWRFDRLRWNRSRHFF